MASPNLTLSAVISGEVMKALRAGMALENIIATLINQAEVLQISLPVVKAISDGKNST